MSGWGIWCVTLGVWAYRNLGEAEAKSLAEDWNQGAARRGDDVQWEARAVEVARAMEAREMQAREMLDGSYKVAITNVARYIRSRRNFDEDGAGLDGYTASMVLSIAFCKAKEEILADILGVKERA
jgi:hypothetical protein